MLGSNVPIFYVDLDCKKVVDDDIEWTPNRRGEESEKKRNFWGHFLSAARNPANSALK